MTDSRISAPDRRAVLRGGLYTAAAVPLGVTLASCATGGGGGDDEETDGGDEPAGDMDPDNPFGMEDGAELEAVVFDGGYGVDYVEFAADIFSENHEGSTVDVAPSTQIAQEMQPRFVSGNPPDLLDNSGSGNIGFNTILDQLEDLTDVIDAPNLEGTPIRDTLYGGVLAPGTFGDKLAAINYVFTVYAVWYSASLFEEHGWTPPTTWAEAKELGAAAKEEGLYLFGWGTEAATYYQTLAIDTAIKEGGDEVRLALENLQPECWSHEAVQGAFETMKEIVDLGYFKPGGSGTQFTAAQAQWSDAQEWLLYPSGSWIENEMKDQTAENFQLTGIPTMSLSESGAMGLTGLHSAAGEPYVVPTEGNVAAAKELLRVMLSEEAATNFCREKLAPTVIDGLVPEDGFGSTALVSQTDMLAAAGEEIFTHNFVDTYGMNQDQLPIWNSFLDGSKTVADLTSELQAVTDRVANDDSIEKIEVS